MRKLPAKAPDGSDWTEEGLRAVGFGAIKQEDGFFYAGQPDADLSNYSAAPSRDLLVNYAKTKQAGLATGGFSFSSGNGSSAIVVEADTTSEGRIDLSGLVQLTDKVPNFSTVWIQSSGPVTLSASQIVDLSVAVGKFYDDTYSTLASVLTAIANGSITTTAQIDAANWPANHS